MDLRERTEAHSNRREAFEGGAGLFGFGATPILSLRIWSALPHCLLLPHLSFGFWFWGKGFDFWDSGKREELRVSFCVGVCRKLTNRKNCFKPTLSNNPINPIFSICLSLQVFNSSRSLLPFPSPVILFLPISLFLSWCHASVSLSLHHTAVSLSLSHCFSTLLWWYAASPFSLSLSFFLVLCLLLCLVLGVWMVRKRGKQRDFLGLLIFSRFVNIFWVC